MADRSTADRTGSLLLLYLRDPAHLRMQSRYGGPLVDSEIVMKLALGRRVEFGDPSLTSARPEKLREAAVAYVRQFNFRLDATPYEVLGIAPDASEQTVKESFRLLMQLVHPDRQNGRAAWPEAFAARANQAYAVLRDPETRAGLDREQAERAARERTVHEKAAAAAALPTAREPAVRRPLPRPLLPEWLTAGVGGFVRAHPAAVAFGAIVVVAASVIAFAAWTAPTATLTRDPGAEAASTQVPAVTAVPATRGDSP
jgi:hypothetical protein